MKDLRYLLKNLVEKLEKKNAEEKYSRSDKRIEQIKNRLGYNKK